MRVSDSLGELVGQGTMTVAYGRCNEDAVNGVITRYNYAQEESKIRLRTKEVILPVGK